MQKKQAKLTEGFSAEANMRNKLKEIELEKNNNYVKDFKDKDVAMLGRDKRNHDDNGEA